MVHSVTAAAGESRWVVHPRVHHTSRRPMTPPRPSGPASQMPRGACGPSRRVIPRKSLDEKEDPPTRTATETSPSEHQTGHAGPSRSSHGADTGRSRTSADPFAHGGPVPTRRVGADEAVGASGKYRGERDAEQASTMCQPNDTAICQCLQQPPVPPSCLHQHVATARLHDMSVLHGMAR